MPDFRVKNEGTIWLFEPVTEQATDWVNDNVLTCDWWGNSFVVEHRYGPPLLEGIVDAELEVSYVH